MTNREIFNEKVRYYILIRNLIFDYGERFPKKHGEWIRLRYTNDSWFIMDSWNQAVYILVGDCEYKGIYIGFDGKLAKYLGMDFGGLEIHQTLRKLKFWYENLRPIYVKRWELIFIV